MGIQKNDVKRQLEEFQEKTRPIQPQLYIIPGRRDQYNDTLNEYKKIINKNLYYSINYGTIHLVFINTLENHSIELSLKQMRWLENDLNAHRNSHAIFIVTHDPIVPPPEKKIRFKQGDELHRIFHKYPVKAVFSAGKNGYIDFEKDTIRYINTGCEGLYQSYQHQKYNQYYSINYECGSLGIQGGQITPVDPK